MAEIGLFEDDSDDALDIGDDSSGDNLDDYDGDPCDPDAGLTPIEKLEKYMDSENMYSRHMVARSLLETLRLVEESDEEVEKVLKCMSRLSEDPEANVRMELMEQVPHIAMYCHENQRPTSFDPVPAFILPIVVKYLTDSNNQVRKTSQAALLVLVEQELIRKDDVEQQVCPVILELSRPESIDDFRTEAVALMSKLAPLVGQDISIRQFLPLFADLCTDALFHVRKVCAANFGDMCSVVGMEHTEKHLLPKFYLLCEDGVWGVRKACAECFMQVSCACSLDVRRKELAQLFISLVCDQSRWVRMAAFQALGAFISTFADPRITGLYFNEEGMLIVGTPQDEEEEDGFSPKQSCSNSTTVPSDCDNNASQSNTSEQNSGTQSAKREDGEAEDDTMEIDCDNITDIRESGITTSASSSSEEEDEDKHAASDEKSVEEKRVEKLASDAMAEAEGEDKDEEAERSIPSESSNNNKEDSNSNNNAPEAEEDAKEASTPAGPGEGVVGDEETKSPGEEGDSSPSSSPPPAPSPPAERPTQLVSKPTKEGGGGENTDSYSSFNFWRHPLPVIDLEDELMSPGGEDGVSVADIKLHELDEVLREVELCKGPSELHTASEGEDSSGELESVANIGSTHVVGHQVSAQTMKIVNGVVQDSGSGGLGFCPADEGSPQAPANTSEEVETSGDEMSSHKEQYSALLQDVIPQALLDHYLSMTDPSRAQTVDTEIAKHCAYSLPAVAYTLGRKHWPCLKELYDTLAADMQWKVRRTLAFSIHELAVIVGEDVTCRDLVPVFNGFLKDLDEVRIGVLKHFADFLKLLLPNMRNDYLSRMSEFLNTDNNRNWRFREELAEQLIMLLDLFPPKDIHEHLTPIAFSLVEDKVAEVRLTSFKVMARMLRRLARDNKLLSIFVNDIKQRLAFSNKWNKRQMFTQLCYCILYDNSISPERFASEFLPSLLNLRNDPIPNVRISLARTVSQHIMYSDYFSSSQNPHHDELLQTVQSLKSDTDRDVRYFINLDPFTNIDEDNDNDTDTIPV